MRLKDKREHLWDSNNHLPLSPPADKEGKVWFYNPRCTAVWSSKGQPRPPPWSHKQSIWVNFFLKKGTCIKKGKSEKMCTFAGSWGRPSKTANPQIFEVRPLFHLQGWHRQALPKSPILMNGSLLEFMFSAIIHPLYPKECIQQWKVNLNLVICQIIYC